LIAALAMAGLTVVTGVVTFFWPNAAALLATLDVVILLASAFILGSFSADSEIKEVKRLQPQIASMNSIEITIGSSTHS